ncbi:MAG: gamma-glutamyltransferase [Xanthomonadales bacterium]|nr:gamma-glutamyltransferase [Xanthomonadales bacterium]
MRKYLHSYKSTLFLSVIAFFFVGCATVTVDVADPSREARGLNGMVAAAHPLASQIGVDILKAGGNAVDAAVAVGFALGVVEPNASGIGGGGFMLIWFADSRTVVFIDSREKAPAAATADMFYLDENGKVKPDGRGFNPAVIGGKSVAVPGEVAGLLSALGKYGSMSRGQVMQPAIDYAEQGITVSPVLAGIIAENYEALANFPQSEKTFLDDGFPKEAGSTLRNPDLANTLRLIAEQGRDAFYHGPVAQSIVDAVQADGGLITMEDLAGFDVSFREPVTSTYRGYEIISAPPPSSGGTHVIELLNIMEYFDVESMGLNSARSIHAWAEAMKLIYGDRAEFMGDSDFIEVPLKGLTSKQYAREQFARIDMNSVMDEAASGDPASMESGSTTHFSVVDRHGNMVAYTKTINHFFASGITTPGTGIVLNDQMDDFDKRPGQANSIAGGKRPLSSMSPTLMLKDGKPFATIGSPGGKRILSTVAMLISDLVDFDMDIQSAINTPRINNYESGSLKIEARIPVDVQNELREMGHQIIVKKDFDLYFGGAQGVVIDQKSGVLHGGADPRRDGKAVGY